MTPASLGHRPALTQTQREQFGRLLKDRRNAAGLTRIQLAERAKLSESTIKFLETAHHPPSRSTLLRLLRVAELQLSWADVPGEPGPPATAPGDAIRPQAERPWLHSQLNCFLTPSYDSLAMLTDLASLLHGAGGYVEQTNAYLDHHSALAYLALGQHSMVVADLRARMPLAQAAKQIRAACGAVSLQVLALGVGDGILETRLVRHLIDEQVPDVELCLLDISQPLLSCAYRHAADALADIVNVDVWAIQCNIHHLPLYTQLYCSPSPRPQRRLFCMLGGTLANLDQEPRFLRQSLLDCAPGDLLLLDLQTVSAPCDNPTAIKRLDALYCGGVSPQIAAWLSGPLWRHRKEVIRVEFSWDLDIYCPVPGSYALHAVATVKSQRHPDSRFSMFRFGRYEPTKLAECLSGIGWEEIGAIAYGGEHSLRLYRKRPDGTLAIGTR